jgi:hypothetical protein
MSIQLDTITLPDGLLWLDEFEPDAVAQTMRRRLDGGVTLFPRGNIAGRPITLEAGPDQWLTRSMAEGLAALAGIPGQQMTLTLRSASFTVVFRHHDPPALELRPLIDYADPADDDPMIGRIKLLTL